MSAVKRKSKTEKGLLKGTPTAVLVSAGIHLALLLMAGGLVVFTIIDKKEAQFVPPAKIDRPKMDLLKPRVKMKQSAKPRAMQRISSKAVQSMPDIQLPEVSSVGSGLSGGVGGFELMPDVSEMGLLGSKKSMAIGNDLQGTFYSLAMDRRGNLLKRTEGEVEGDLKRFFSNDWNPRAFARYYRMPQKLYATQIMIPPVNSTIGPQQFGMDESMPPVFWMILYKGKIARPEGGRFRFCGSGDDILAVRVNGKTVLNASYWGPGGKYQSLMDFQNASDKEPRYWLGNSVMYVGDWFELKPGEPVEIEVLIGEVPGGEFYAMLLVEEEGEEYSVKEDGGPVLPIFKTAEIPDSVRREIEYSLIPGEADLEDDLMFNVY